MTTAQKYLYGGQPAETESATGVIGVSPAIYFSRLKHKDGGQRRHTHAILVFDEAAYGPVLTDAGRFRGYGFCREIGREHETGRRQQNEEDAG